MQPAVRTEGLFHGPVEVVIVRKLDMATDIPGEPLVIDIAAGEAAGFGLVIQYEKILVAERLEAVGGTNSGRDPSRSISVTARDGAGFGFYNADDGLSHSGFRGVA